MTARRGLRPREHRRPRRRRPPGPRQQPHAVARTEAERAELTAAARSVAKVWMLRHEIQGVPLPDGFAERHPEAIAAAPTSQARGGSRAKIGRLPQRGRDPGPARWPSSRTDLLVRPDHHADDRLGLAGQARSPVLLGPPARHHHRAAPRSPRWCAWSTARPATTTRAAPGPYVVLDISRLVTFSEWCRLMMRHIADYRAPLVLHPVLLKQYYPYLDDDACGHFQVGRGYDKNGERRPQDRLLRAVEPAALRPARARTSTASSGAAPTGRYRANQAHFQHNIGV